MCVKKIVALMIVLLTISLPVFGEANLDQSTVVSLNSQTWTVVARNGSPWPGDQAFQMLSNPSELPSGYSVSLVGLLQQRKYYDGCPNDKFFKSHRYTTDLEGLLLNQLSENGTYILSPVEEPTAINSDFPSTLGMDYPCYVPVGHYVIHDRDWTDQLVEAKLVSANLVRYRITERSVIHKAADCGNHSGGWYKHRDFTKVLSIRIPLPEVLQMVPPTLAQPTPQSQVVTQNVYVNQTCGSCGGGSFQTTAPTGGQYEEWSVGTIYPIYRNTYSFPPGQVPPICTGPIPILPVSPPVIMPPPPVTTTPPNHQGDGSADPVSTPVTR